MSAALKNRDILAMEKAVLADDAPAIRALAEKDARLLVFLSDKYVEHELPAGSLWYPLNGALQGNHLRAAEAILQELQKREAELLPLMQRPQIEIHPACRPYFGSSPLYVEEPHTHAKSPEALRLLKRYGYNFIGQKKNGAFENHPTHILEPTLKRGLELDIFRWEWFESMMNAAMKVTPESNRHKTQLYAFEIESLGFYPIALHAFNLLGKDIASGFSSSFMRSKEGARVLLIMAAAGVDFRQWRINPPLVYATGDIGNAVHTLHRTFREAVLALPAQFLSATPEEKSRIARICAATGDFPVLLSHCVRSGDAAAFAQAVEALDDSWRGEYRHAIRTAEATLARIAPVERSALSAYLSGRSV